MNYKGLCSCVYWSGGGDPATQEGGCTFTTHWDTPGVKTVTAGNSNDGCSSSKQKQVTIVELDLDISGIAEDDEEDPGGYVGVNNDDDNTNSTADKEESGTVSGEDDLVAITLSLSPAVSTGTATLSATAGGSKES